jgi:hypothetical protein
VVACEVQTEDGIDIFTTHLRRRSPIKGAAGRFASPGDTRRNCYADLNLSTALWFTARLWLANRLLALGRKAVVPELELR